MAILAFGMRINSQFNSFVFVTALHDLPEHNL